MIYLITNKSNSTCKIGYSKNPKKRLKALQTAVSSPLELTYVITGGYELELELHKLFINSNIEREWFNLTSSILAYFKNKVDEEIRSIPLFNRFDIKPSDLGDMLECSYSEINTSKELYNQLAKNTSTSGRSLYFYIQYNLLTGKDTIDLIPKKVCSLLSITRPTYYSAINQLERIDVIAKNKGANYWVNPNYLRA